MYFHCKAAGVQTLSRLCTPVTIVVDLLEVCLVHGDGVIQASPGIPLQVLPIAVTAEDQGLRHKHAIALGWKHDDLQHTCVQVNPHAT